MQQEHSRAVREVPVEFPQDLNVSLERLWSAGNLQWEGRDSDRARERMATELAEVFRAATEITPSGPLSVRQQEFLLSKLDALPEVFSSEIARRLAMAKPVGSSHKTALKVLTAHCTDSLEHSLAAQELLRLATEAPEKLMQASAFRILARAGNLQALRKIPLVSAKYGDGPQRTLHPALKEVSALAIAQDVSHARRYDPDFTPAHMLQRMLHAARRVQEASGTDSNSEVPDLRDIQRQASYMLRKRAILMKDDIALKVLARELGKFPDNDRTVTHEAMQAIFALNYPKHLQDRKAFLSKLYRTADEGQYPSDSVRSQLLLQISQWPIGHKERALAHQIAVQLRQKTGIVRLNAIIATKNLYGRYSGFDRLADILLSLRGRLSSNR